MGRKICWITFPIFKTDTGLLRSKIENNKPLTDMGRATMRLKIRLASGARPQVIRSASAQLNLGLHQ
jgi:hypothetical protein